ncbi:MAG: peptide-methionine (R)-S-oxide reductase MsrB [Candidatus Omnitrophica bacterium]|nr:peptide-methionine (R)-S-oxide reductase MsrB [Candidatus Omnitrophota bacterium]
MKDKLTDLEYHVAFEAGTERPFTSPLNKNKRSGVYKSIVSGNDLFHSDHKFDSGTGWPSFYRPVNESNIELREDNSLFMKRVEVVDAVSGAHLGHVFKDGPPPTGLRYCINGAALKFVEGVPFKEPPQ